MLTVKMKSQKAEHQEEGADWVLICLTCLKGWIVEVLVMIQRENINIPVTIESQREYY